jgi:hypothetical protein
VSTLLTVVIEAAFVFEDGEGIEFDLTCVVLPPFAFVAAPIFIMRLFTAACATDLKSASVGGLDKTEAAGAAAGAVDIVA